jgi:hypothetical protein
MARAALPGHGDAMCKGGHNAGHQGSRLLPILRVSTVER